jgi:hypothetical protein
MAGLRQKTLAWIISVADHESEVVAGAIIRLGGSKILL